MVSSHRLKGHSILAVLLIVFLLAPAAQGEAAVKYVTPAGAGSKNGATWGNAMDASGFENGVKTAPAYTEYWLAEGGYPITHTLEPGHRVSIYGGFAGNETSIDERDLETNHTLLACQGNFRMMRVAANFSVSVDGLYITGGDASAGSGGAVLVEGGAKLTAAGCFFFENQGDSGGAIFGENGSEFKANNCIFAYNTAMYGGAVEVFNNSTATASNCTFVGNEAGRDGGAAYVDNNSTFTAAGCTFRRNEAGRDGGAAYVGNNSTFTAAGCTFDHNDAENYGGSVALYGNSTFQAGNSVFHRNEALYIGGAVYACSNSTFTGKNCTFDGNEAKDGGAVYEDSSTVTTSNCTFVGNEAVHDGGAAKVCGGSALTAVNCTFSGSTAGEKGQAVYLKDPNTTFTAVNTIFWGDGGKKQIDRGSTVNTNNIRIAYCIIGGGYDPNEGVVNDIVNKDPTLGLLAKNGGPAKTITRTMALLAGSPAIDSGTDAFTGIDIPGEDQRGVSRPRGSGYDIGAYEFEPSQDGGASGGSGGGCSSASFAPPALLLLLPLAALLRGRR